MIPALRRVFTSILRMSEEAATRRSPPPANSPPPAKKFKKQSKVKVKKFKEQPIDPISSEGILITDIKHLLQTKNIDLTEAQNDMQEFFNRPRGEPHPEHCEQEVSVISRSSVGDGLALYKDSHGKSKVMVVPYTMPGEKVVAKVYKTQKYYFNGELVKIIEKAPTRDDSLIKCKYFNKCSGCQYQMIPYEEQLEIKRQVIVNSFKHYAPKLKNVPEILSTVGSPDQYGYRTKLTPHFDVPRKQKLDAPPPIGFGIKGRKTVADIEECVIGTNVVNQGLTQQRKYVHEHYNEYKRGATLLLRETAKSPTERECVTNTKEVITEYVGDFKFQYPASSFFQNNNSILPAVTSYVRDNVVLPTTGKPPKYLVDTYCGSGLFAVTCSGNAESVIGVEISKDSVEYATKNAELNNLSNASFIVGQAEKIFEKVNTPPMETSIIIDPPRKGCDQAFLDQLLDFKPVKIVYVSCNVHSQSRDIEYLLTKNENYQIDSIRGFDFFPQTHHVESVAVLSLNTTNA